MKDAGRDPAAGKRIRKAMLESPGWPGSAAALEDAARKRGTPVSAATIRSWFEGAPPQIPNLVKVAPILGRPPLEFYAAWFDEPLSSSGLDRIANAIDELRRAIVPEPPDEALLDRAAAEVRLAEERAGLERPQSTSRRRRSDQPRNVERRRRSLEGEAG